MTTGNYTVPVTRAVLSTGSAQSMYPAVLYKGCSIPCIQPSYMYICMYTILSHTTVTLFLAHDYSAWACVSYLRYWHYAKCRAKDDSKKFLWYCFLLQGYVPLFQGILVRQQLSVTQNFLFWVPFTIAALYLDFWLIVCGDTRVLTVATMWATSTFFPAHIHYPPCFIFSRFCSAGMNSVGDIFHKPCPLGLSRHLKHFTELHSWYWHSHFMELLSF